LEISLIFYSLSFLWFLSASAQRFALPALGRAAERRPIGKRLRRRKMLENAAESPASGARFVGRFFVVQDSFIEKKLHSIFLKYSRKIT
jgi:hypothetical protein